MNAELWARVQEVFLAALEVAPAERGALVGRRCAGDDELRTEVERLLMHHDSDPDYLEEPAIRPPRPEAGAESTGVSIGPYRAVRALGEGGMGVVHLAIREEPDFRLPVAIKVIRPGMDTEDVLRRFKVEQQILASLSHPNIAQVIDAGTTEDGRPYFVMEFIEGVRIDRYCSERAASVDERLALFAKICDAVQHAHRNLVVHRDIKPSNVLVTPDGVPKLLDFGIGKVLAPSAVETEAARTRTDMRCLTPEYAAPEQIRGEAVTTATDVHGLGLLLYRLLTGRHPYLEGGETPAEVERAILERDPPRPSAVAMSQTRATGAGASAGLDRRLRRRLAGDLDTIALTALRKEPDRRYPSAGDLAADLRGYSAGRPISARPDTAAYRLGKFVRRNAWAVTAAAAVFAGLVVTSLVTVAQSARVASERDAAIQERDKALEVRGFLMEMFGATGDAPTDSITSRELLDLQAGALENAYRDRPVLRAEMMEVLADGYERLGLYDDAEPLARAALAVRREHLPGRHPDIASSLNVLGWILSERGRSAEALPLLEEAVAIRREAGATQEVQLSRSLNDLGVVAQRLDDLERAEALYVEALEIRSRLLGESHRGVGTTANNLGGIRFQLGDYPGAVEAFERSLASLRQAVGPDHARSLTAESNLATAREMAGDREGATEAYRELRERALRLFGPAHRTVTHPTRELAVNLTDAGRLDEARALVEETLAALEQADEGASPRAAEMHFQLGAIEAASGDHVAAAAAYEEAVRIYRQSFGPSHSSLVTPLVFLGTSRREHGDLAGSVQSLTTALQVAEETLGSESGFTLGARYELGLTLLRADRLAESLAAFSAVERQSLAHAAESQGFRRLHDRARAGIATVRLGLGDVGAADSVLDALRAAVDSGIVDADVRAEVEALATRLDSLGRL